MNLHPEIARKLAHSLTSAGKVTSALVAIEWHATGSSTGRKPGTVYRVKVSKFSLDVLIYLPAPRNNRKTALGVFCSHLLGLTPKVENAEILTS